MNKNILKWELFGALFISVIGAVFHFLFEWLGSFPPIGGFFPVNESVWEHLKIGFWPALVYAIIEYPYLNKQTSNFIFAKTMGILAIPLSIAMLFYTYSGVFGEEVFLADILIFFAAVAIGQYISYRLLIKGATPRALDIVGLTLVITLAFMFAFYTYYPPQLPIFQDPMGIYGIS